MNPAVHRLADGIWSCEQPDGTRRIRQVVIAGGTTALVVDTGLPDSPAAGLLDLLEELGLAVAVLLTHPDADHVGGTAAVLDRFPRARVLAGRADAALIGDPERTIRERYAAFVADGVPFDEAEADRARRRFGRPFGPVAGVGDDERLNLGDRPVELLATSGHSPGHTAAWVPDAAVLATGDAVMGAGIPDLDGALLIPPMYAPPRAYHATIDRLMTIPAALTATGHEPVLDRPAADRFLALSRAACDRLAGLVAGALDDRPATLAALCRDVHEAYGGLPAGRHGALAMAVDGHLAELAATGEVAVDAGPPRTFRRPT